MSAALLRKGLELLEAPAGNGRARRVGWATRKSPPCSMGCFSFCLTSDSPSQGCRGCCAVQQGAAEGSETEEEEGIGAQKGEGDSQRQSHQICLR